jgi:hypothetical protein
MKHDIFENILNIAKDQEDNLALKKLKNALYIDYNETVVLTIKNYNKANGLSLFIHEEIPIRSH